MKTNFTPGPWRVIRTGPCGPATERFWVGKDSPNPEWRGPSVVGDTVQFGDHVFEGNANSGEECKANAHLIAASPKMYDQIDRAVEEFGHTGTISVSRMYELQKVLKQARGES